MAAASMAFPHSGNYNINLSTSILDIAKPPSKKRSRSSDEMIALRYTFKPGSITPDMPGTLSAEDRGRQLTYDTPGGGQQVFDVRQETSKSRECVLIWDEESQAFTLHVLPTTLHLTLNRTLSSTTKRPARSGSPGSTSTSSSKSIPLQSQSEAPSKRNKPTPTPSEASLQTPANRPTRAGKSLPSLPPQPQPTKKATKAPSKSGKSLPIPPTRPKKAGKKIPPPIQTGKHKSAEIIEDSDEEIGVDDEEEDEFARLVGESLADFGTPGGNGEEEESEEDEEDEDEARELGGARLVVRNEDSRPDIPEDSSSEESE